MTDEKQTGLTVKKPDAFKKDPDVVPEVLLHDEQKEKTIKKSEKEDKIGKESPLEPDPETLHTTDPQEKMEGPISSIMQTIKEAGESTDVVSKEEADRKKDENT